jgi:PAS domain S-box-containing protein
MALQRLMHQLARGPRQLSLRWLLIVPFVLQLTGVVGLTAWLSYRNSQQAVQELAERFSAEIGDRVQQHLSAYLHDPVLINTLNGDAERLGQLNIRDFASLQRYFWRQAQLFDTVRYIYYATIDGEFVGVGRNANGTFEIGVIEAETGLSNFQTYAVYRKGERGQQLEQLPNYYVTERPWYRAALQAGKPAWSPVYVWTAPRRNVAGVDAVRPVYSLAGNIEGVLGVSLRIEDLNTFLRGLRVGETGQVFVVERSGMLVATSTGEGSIRIPIPDQPAQRFLARHSRSELTQETALFLEQYFGSLDNVTRSQQLSYRPEAMAQWGEPAWWSERLGWGDRRFVQVAPFRDRYGLDWLVVVVVPESDFMARLNANARNTLGLSLLALTGAIAVGWLIAQGIARPIARLGAASQAIANGDFDRRVRVQSVRELVVLEQAFNRMGDRLRQSFQELAQTNVKLEQRVAQRTAALSQSEEKFSRAFHASPDAITLSTLDEGRLIEVNDSFLNLFGYTAAEAIGKTSAELGLWATESDRLDLVQRLQTGASTRQLEYQGRTKTGEIRDLQVSSELIELKGQPSLLLVIHDITERKQAREQLARTLALQTATFESIADGIVAFDLTGQITSYNRRFLEIWHLTPAFLDLATPQDQVQCLGSQLVEGEVFVNQMQALVGALEGETEGILECRDGRVFDQHSIPLWAEDQVVGRVWTFRDITDRRRAEEAIRRAEANYRSIVENAAEGIFQSTPDQGYISANPALVRIFGYASPQDLVNQLVDPARQLYVDPTRRQVLMQQIAEQGAIANAESEVYRADGTKIWISENVHAVWDHQGNLQYYEGTVEDITKRKAAEDALRAEQRKSEQLLLNILPEPIANLLKHDRRPIAEHFEEVTILFADIVGFTPMSAQMRPAELVSWLDRIFSRFDSLADQHGLEKIKTIGDAYMVAAGLPVARPDHAEAIAQMALDMQAAAAQVKGSYGDACKLRIGIHSGPVIAGVIGTSKFIYDLWGDTVNVASRMESQGKPGRIQATASAYRLLKDCYLFEERGAIEIKGRGWMRTYWLVGRRVDGDPPDQAGQPETPPPISDRLLPERSPIPRPDRQFLEGDSETPVAPLD